MTHGNIEMKNGRRRNNYPAERQHAVRGKIYTWRERLIGQDALVVLYFAISERASTDQIIHSRSYKNIGITDEFLESWIQRYLPEFFQDYQEYCGVPYDPSKSLFIKRVYMWFLKHKGKGLGCHAGMSSEHPLQWAGDLIDHWDKRIKRHRRG